MLAFSVLYLHTGVRRETSNVLTLGWGTLAVCGYVYNIYFSGKFNVELMEFDCPELVYQLLIHVTLGITCCLNATG